MGTQSEQHTTYSDRLMFYELCVRRSRWYGAALAAAIAYSVGGLVEHETALAVVIVGIVVAGVTLSMQLFLYENEVLKIQRITTRIGSKQPLNSETSPASFGATFCRYLTWQFIGIVAIVVAGDRILYTLVKSPLSESPTLVLYALTVVGSMVVHSVIYSLISAILEVKRLNCPNETAKGWWGRPREIIMATSLSLTALYVIPAVVIWWLRL